MKTWKLKVALCALSTLTMGALAVASGVADLTAAFPKVPVSMVQMLITAPILAQTPVTLFSGVFCRYASKKQLLMLACVLFMAGGLPPYFVHAFPVILLMRCVYGAGIGLVVPLTASLVMEYFQGSERAAVMGLNSAVGMLGGAFYTYVGGQLSVIGWQYCFLAYLIGLPVLLTTALLLPSGAKETKSVQTEVKHRRLPAVVFVVALTSLVYLVFYFAYTNYISLFVASTGLGNASHSGISYSIVNTCGFLGGLCFGGLSRRAGCRMLPISVAVTTQGFFILGMSQSLPVLYSGSVLIGVGLSWFLPQTQLMIGAAVTQEACTYAYGVNGAISNAGQFLSALVLGPCAAVLGVSSERGMILMAAWGYAALTVFCG
ncbi:MAG: MFS transporter, partial [Lawsonibacter sp.]